MAWNFFAKSFPRYSVRKYERAPLKIRNIKRYINPIGMTKESQGSIAIKSLTASVTPLRARTIINNIIVTENVAAVFTAERVTMVCS